MMNQNLLPETTKIGVQIYRCKWDVINTITGNMRRFRRICEHTQSVVSVIRRPPPPSSPRAQRRVTSGPTVTPGSTSNAANMIIGGKSSAGRASASG